MNGCGGTLQKQTRHVFFCQAFLIYVVVVTSLVNLTLKNGPINLWIALLGSCLGYLLPHPSIDPQQHQHHAGGEGISGSGGDGVVTH